MTREEFRDSITDFYDLINFCRDNDYYEFVEDIMDNDDLDEQICEEIRDMTYNDSWVRVRNFLNRIEVGYDFYKRTMDGDYTGLTDYDLEYYLDDLEDILDNNDFFYDPEEEPQEEVNEEIVVCVESDNAKQDDNTEISMDEFMSIFKTMEVD